MYVWRLLLRNYNSAFTAATTIENYIKNGSCLKMTDVGGIKLNARYDGSVLFKYLIYLSFQI